MNDVKTLWGRAANRCAFPDCKIELTIEGGKDTLGEMAHIVAKSPDGPRGGYNIPSESKDTYDNLILLCPTHHKIIDNDPKEWTVEKLRQLKEDHEKWVTIQLNNRAITIPSIDNSVFLDSRKKDWLDFAKDYVWVISSITPLNISEDVIDPLEQKLLTAVNTLELPRDISCNTNVNSYHTRPNEYGLINEDLRGIERGVGYRIQVFRNGHCEFLICLQCGTKKINEIYKDSIPNELSGAKVLWYEDILNCFRYEIRGLNKIWDIGLPSNNMLLTNIIINTSSTCLYVCKREFRGPYVGSKVFSNKLEYNNVINKGIDVNALFELVIKRFVNYFGLVLDKVFDENGNIIKPRKLS